jgi:hypothetical protein
MLILFLLKRKKKMSEKQEFYSEFIYVTNPTPQLGWCYKTQTWTQKNGTKLRPQEMGTRHIINCISMLYGNDYTQCPNSADGFRALVRELNKRLPEIKVSLSTRFSMLNKEQKVNVLIDGCRNANVLVPLTQNYDCPDMNLLLYSYYLRAAAKKKKAPTFLDLKAMSEDHFYMVLFNDLHKWNLIRDSSF